MSSTQQAGSDSRPQTFGPAPVAHAPGVRAPSVSPDPNAPASVAPEKTAATPTEIEPDPESITNIAEGNFLVKIAVAVVILFAAFALVVGFG